MSPTEPNASGFDGFWTGTNPNAIDLQAQNEQVVANDPDGTNPTGAIYLWNPNAVNNNGLFPSRFPSTVSNLEALLSLIRSDMSYSERLGFKRKLWAAGYYTPGMDSPVGVTEDSEGNEVTGLQIRESLSGKWEGDKDEAAIRLLVANYGKQNEGVGRTGAAVDLDATYADDLFSNANQTRSDMIQKYNMPKLYLQIQSMAQEALSRELNETEVQTLLDQVFAFDSREGEASSTQWSAANAELDPLTRQQIVTGGGDNSSAINFGRGLASTYNLVVDASLNMQPRMIGATSEFEEAFREGRAVKITGDRQRMIKLHEWANTQKTENGVFENVRFIYDGNSNEPTGLLLSMREGAMIPTMAASNFSYGQRTTDLDKFLDSVKRPGDVYAYSWEGDGPNRRGAYGLSDQIWEFYSNQIGIDSSDTSITAQDRVARAYVADLWDRYGSWKEVALALRINEDTANRRKADRAAQGDGYVDVVTDPNEIAWADEAIAKMGSWTPVLDASKSQDLYQSMYGAGALYSPVNIFAGTPETFEEALAKSSYMFSKSYSGEMNVNKILQDVAKNASKRKVADFSKLERKWQ